MHIINMSRTCVDSAGVPDLHVGDARTPLNFVCTADIANGNSGSPVVNRKNEVVGVVFDGNLESLGNSFIYDGERARAVCVHSAAILEVLEKVYQAQDLVKEIRGGKAR